MGIVRNPANTMRRGRVGETTYYISGGQQIARQALNGSNFGESARRSSAQQERRVLWANLVNFYKASKNWMPKAFETKKRNQSDYNKFMQLNINSTKVALTKSEAEAGACVADAFLVSQGSLPSIAVRGMGVSWLTNIATGSLSIDAETTVGQFSTAILNANANIREGMQLSFVSYQQSVDTMGTPRLISRCYEVTFDTTSSELLYNSFPDFCATTSQGFLGTSENISIGGFAYILSELTGNKLAVSTQQLITWNVDLLNRYTSDVQRKAAIESYGVDQEVILSPVGTITQTPEAQPWYVSTVNYNSRMYSAGDYLGTIGQLSGKTIQPKLSRTPSTPVSTGEVITADGQVYSMDCVTTTSTLPSFVIESGITSNSPIVKIKVLDALDNEAVIGFSSSETDSDL